MSQRAPVRARRDRRDTSSWNSTSSWSPNRSRNGSRLAAYQPPDTRQNQSDSGGRCSRTTSSEARAGRDALAPDVVHHRRLRAVDRVAEDRDQPDVGMMLPSSAPRRGRGGAARSCSRAWPRRRSARRSNRRTGRGTSRCRASRRGCRCSRSASRNRAVKMSGCCPRLMRSQRVAHFCAPMMTNVGSGQRCGQDRSGHGSSVRDPRRERGCRISAYTRSIERPVRTSVGSTMDEPRLRRTHESQELRPAAPPAPRAELGEPAAARPARGRHRAPDRRGHERRARGALTVRRTAEGGAWLEHLHLHGGGEPMLVRTPTKGAFVVEGHMRRPVRSGLLFAALIRGARRARRR